MTIEDLNPAQRQRYRIPPNIEGVLVSKVEAQSKAELAGFEMGDIIAQVENINIKTTADLQDSFKRFYNKPKRILAYGTTGAKIIILK